MDNYDPETSLEIIAISDDSDVDSDVDSVSDIYGIPMTPGVESYYRYGSDISGGESAIEAYEGSDVTAYSCLDAQPPESGMGRGFKLDAISSSGEPQGAKADAYHDQPNLSYRTAYPGHSPEEKVGDGTVDDPAAAFKEALDMSMKDPTEDRFMRQAELKEIYDCLASIHQVLDRTKARSRASDNKISRTTGYQAKRKRQVSSIPSRKKQKRKPRHEIRIRATAAWVQFGEEEEACKYIWTRYGGGRYWVADSGRNGGKQVDGGYLLYCGLDLSVEIRANAHEHPIVVKWNDEREVFEGWDSIEEDRRLTVTDDQMIDMVNGGSGYHVGIVDLV